MPSPLLVWSLPRFRRLLLASHAIAPSLGHASIEREARAIMEREKRREMRARSRPKNAWATRDGSHSSCDLDLSAYISSSI